jgi:hypothetical protein
MTVLARRSPASGEYLKGVGSEGGALERERRWGGVGHGDTTTTNQRRTKEEGGATIRTKKN